MDTASSPRPAEPDTRFSRGSIALTVLGLGLAVLLMPFAVAAASAPLPTGSYDIDVDGAAVNVRVTPSGKVAVSAEDGVVVVLEFDDDGRVLDRFVASTADATYEVAVEVGDAGTYEVEVLADVDEDPVDVVASGRPAPVGGNDEVAANHGELVSAVARCAPRGAVAARAGWPNHGSVVSAAASGLTVTVPVVDTSTGAQRQVTTDLTTVGGVISFCDLADDLWPARSTGAGHTVD